MWCGIACLPCSCLFWGKPLSLTHPSITTTTTTTTVITLQVSALAYSPDGQYLAVGDSNREVSVFARGKSGGEWTALVQGQWVHHTSRITALAWSPSGQVSERAMGWDGMGWAGYMDHAWFGRLTIPSCMHRGPQHLASGSLDSSIIIWSVENPKSRTTLDGASRRQGRPYNVMNK